MNFLKISGLIIGTSSFVGSAGAGIYYATNNKNSTTEESIKKNIEQENPKHQFYGKLVFEKETENNDNYQIKLLTESEYITKTKEFNKDKNELDKYEKVNKVIEISHELNFSEIKTKLQEIFETPSLLSVVKSKISEKETDLKNMFGDTIYTQLQEIS